MEDMPHRTGSTKSQLHHYAHLISDNVRVVTMSDNEFETINHPVVDDDDFSLTSAEIAADKIATIDDLLRDLFTHVEGLPKSEKIAIARTAGARLRLAKATMGEIVGTISAATINEPGEVLSF